VSQTIERESPVPYYEQLFGILRDQIVRGEIGAEERLPSELELCRAFGLSRATVRQTLSKLENEGYARRVPRRGVFASMPSEPSGWTVQEGFLESQLRHGRTGVETRVVSAGFSAPPPHVSDALRVPADEDVFVLERVRSLDGQVAMFSTNWFPNEVGRSVSNADDVLTGRGSVNERLRDSGFVTAGAKRTIRAMRVTPRIAEFLLVPTDHPVLQVRSLSWDQNGRRFDYYETWVLTDVVPLEVSVSAG